MLKILLIILLVPIIYTIILKWVYPPITMTQLDSVLKGRGLDRQYVSWSKISVNEKKAVLAAEDYPFYQHNGFDGNRICRQILIALAAGKPVGGTATISQQTAKNVFLWQGHSWFEKIPEAYFTFLIENIWGKQRILEIYLNVIEMGNGIFGIEAASQRYFHKSAKELNPKEASIIASCLQNPRTHTINPMSEYVKNRYPIIMHFIR